MKIKVGDNVRVITGSNKGKEGKVLKVLRNENRVLVDGVNEYGIGKWRVILANSKLCRDEVGLKDRWRNLIKGSHVKWNSLSKKYYIVD